MAFAAKFSSGLLVLATLGPARAATQETAIEPARTCPAVQHGTAHAEPGELVRELYRLVSGPAGGLKDWARLRELHAPGAIITFPRHVEDALLIATYNVDQFTALNDKLFGQRGFFEVELKQEVRKFGHVAHVWSGYASSERPDTKPYVYGINSFQLLNDGKRWCVLSATWDGEAARHAEMRDWMGQPAAARLN